MPPDLGREVQLRSLCHAIQYLIECRTSQAPPVNAAILYCLNQDIEMFP